MSIVCVRFKPPDPLCRAFERLTTPPSILPWLWTEPVCTLTGDSDVDRLLADVLDGDTITGLIEALADGPAVRLHRPAGSDQSYPLRLQPRMLTLLNRIGIEVANHWPDRDGRRMKYRALKLPQSLSWSNGDSARWPRAACPDEWMDLNFDTFHVIGQAQTTLAPELNMAVA